MNKQHIQHTRVHTHTQYLSNGCCSTRCVRQNDTFQEFRDSPLCLSKQSSCGRHGNTPVWPVPDLPAHESSAEGFPECTIKKTQSDTNEQKSHSVGYDLCFCIDCISFCSILMSCCLVLLFHVWRLKILCPAMLVYRAPYVLRSAPAPTCVLSRRFLVVFLVCFRFLLYHFTSACSSCWILLHILVSSV